MSRKRKPQAIHVRSRWYWDRANGNAYAAAVAVIYFRDGTQGSVTVGAESGGCDYAVQRACDALESTGYMPKREHYPRGGRQSPTEYFRDRKIPFTTSETQVSRMREI